MGVFFRFPGRGRRSAGLLRSGRIRELDNSQRLRLSKLCEINHDVRVQVERWNWEAEFYELAWREAGNTTIHIEAFQPPWDTAQTVERSLDADTIVDVPWRVPRPVSDVEQAADLGISVSPEGYPFQVAVELATVEPLQLAALVHDFAKTPACLVIYKRGRKAKTPSMVEPIATPTKAEPTSVPVVPAPPVAARAMVAVVAVAASEPVVVAKPQPYEHCWQSNAISDCCSRRIRPFDPAIFRKTSIRCVNTASIKSDFLAAKAKNASVIMDATGWKQGLVKPIALSVDSVFFCVLDHQTQWIWCCSIPKDALYTLLDQSKAGSESAYVAGCGLMISECAAAGNGVNPNKTSWRSPCPPTSWHH